MAITRHGVNRTNMGPLMKCASLRKGSLLLEQDVEQPVSIVKRPSQKFHSRWLFGSEAALKRRSRAQWRQASSGLFTLLLSFT